MEKKYVSITKISSSSSHNVFLQKRFFCLLNRCKENPTICVCAHVAYEKATPLINYIKKRGFPNLWHQLDSGDRCIDTFFYNIGLATAKLS